MIAGLIVALLAGCSSSSSSSSGGSGGDGGAGSDGGGSGSCQHVTVCTSLAHINALCGTTAAVMKPGDETDAAQIADHCEYDEQSGPASFVTMTRYCFTDPANAALLYTGARNDAQTGRTDVDVPGVGDKAFYQEEVGNNNATIYVMKGDILVFVTVSSVVNAQNVSTLEQQCLMPLAKEILAL
jgi:hypothetical protein